jgi:hypothetical protein
MDESLKSDLTRIAIRLGLVCVATAAIGFAAGIFITRTWIDPKVYCFLYSRSIALDPYSRRIAFPIEVSLSSYARGPLQALDETISRGQRLDVLMYDFRKGGAPQVMFSTPLDRWNTSGMAGWGKDGFHVRYSDRNGHRHLVVNPESGTVTEIPQSLSNAVADSLNRIQHELEETPDYREVRWERFKCTDKNPRTGRDTLLFEYSKEYAGIPLMYPDTAEAVGARGGTR